MGYVDNNPINFNDPSGHARCNEDGECWDNNRKLTKRIHIEDYEHNNKKKIIKPINLIDSYCSDAASELYCVSNAAQDVATLIDIVGAGFESVSIFGGCFIGGPAGCAKGWEAGIKLWNFPIFGPFSLNNIEATFSLASLVFTAAADIEDGGGGFFGMAENTSTSLVTFSLGQMSPDPIVDLAIDGYASGYNHGIFNDVITIISGGSVLK